MTTEQTGSALPWLPAPAALQPFEVAIEGVATTDDRPNTVVVRAVATLDPEWEDRRPVDGEVEWAADYEDRQLVQMDTNYKPSRPGPHPVDLTRVDAARVAAAVLQAIEDTFHYTRVGELRAAEAAELLRGLDEVEFALSELRRHALEDLLRRVGLDEDNTPSTGMANVPGEQEA